MTQAVFFESIASADRWLVARYLARGYRVLVFDFTYQLMKIAWLRELIHVGRVERIYIHHASRADGLAIDAAEWFYPKVSGHPLIRRLSSIFGPEETEPVFKHALVQGVFRYFYTRLFLVRAIETGSVGRRVTLVPDSFCLWDHVLQDWCKGRLPPLEGVQISRLGRLLKAGLREWANVADRVLRYLDCGRYLLATSLGWSLARKSKGEEPLRATHVVAIASEYFARVSKWRGFDFLLDHKSLTKENTVFLVSSSGDGPWVEEVRQAGYRVVRQSDYSSLKGVVTRPPCAVGRGLAFKAVLEGFRRIRSPEWLHQAAGSGLQVYLRETNIFERLGRFHYIYANQYGLFPRWRNALIRKLGGKSWWFAYSSGGGYTRCEGGEFASDNDFGGRHRLWSYENADHFVAPCRPLIEYHRRHPQQIREYHDVGNIWSEQILQAEKMLSRDAVLREWFGSLAEGRKVVAWFDSSFVEALNSPSTFSEAILWYSDILRLADERADLLMVIKPSKDAGYYIADRADQQWSFPKAGKRLVQVWAALRRHPRVCFLEPRADPSVVIAVSDLTVTFCYTSVSAEALGARRRAIWYEPGERWRNTLYARVPLLVAHGYTELRSLVETLLWKTSDEQYQAYLDNTIRGLMDSFVDGKGVSRFRALLSGGGVQMPSHRGQWGGAPFLAATSPNE